ncbi:MAG: MFS transporter [Gammaproteobacteria bacterium]|jgi:predicted MFS family arabinose efflux permease|nr:MFS transporter [Gammaproteobacteria bacterium]
MTDINSRKSIIAIIYIGVIGPCVFILQPGFIQGLVAYLGFDEQQAGLIASYEMFGIATTTILMSFISNRVDWHKVLYVCLIVCAVGNMASIGQTDFMLLSVTRFVIGLGSGGLLSLGFTMAGLTSKPDRNFGLIVVWLLIYGAFGMLFMPSIYEFVGMNGLYIFLALFCASGLFIVKSLPHSGEIVELPKQIIEYSTTIKVSSLSGLLVYNIAIGIVWAYLFLVGLEAGMGEQDVANAITVSQFFGIGGALVPVLLQARVGRILPLGIGILGGAGFIFLFVGDIGSAMFWIGVCGFNMLWNLTVPFLFSVLADYDIRGRIVTFGVSMQFLGLALGPFIAAMLLEVGGFDLVNITSVVIFVFAALLMLPGTLNQRNKKQEALNS